MWMRRISGGPLLCLKRPVKDTRQFQNFNNMADLNAKNVGGKTPLDYAIENNHTNIADLLRQHGGKTGKELEAKKRHIG